MAIKKTVLVLLIVLFPMAMESKKPEKRKVPIGNPCDQRPCLNGGMCFDEPFGQYSCQCKEGWVGRRCEVPIERPCDQRPCLNGGMCFNEPFGEYSCQCKEGWVGRRCEVPDERNFQISFPNKTVNDFVTMNTSRNAPPLTAFTVCLWIKVADQSDDGTLFSYALPDEDNEVLVTDYSNFKLLINGRKKYMNVPNVSANDDQWHHICTTWENSAGTWHLYIDGDLKGNGTNFKTGHVVNSDGIIVLGQDQDDFGGGFEQEQSFFGEMYGVNVWDTDLPSEKIVMMSTSCFNEGGNYLRWSDFRAASFHGDVSITSPTTCSP